MFCDTSRKNRIIAFTVCIGILSVFATGIFREASSQSAHPLEVGTEAQLFIDHRFIDQSENVTLKLNQPLLPAGDVLIYERPWETAGGTWTTVREDEGIYKMWYDVSVWDPQAEVERSLCYATSQDGIHWEKPSLGIIESGGSTDNNIVMAGTHGTVFIDPVANRGQRYKYVGRMWPDSRWEETKGTLKRALYVCFSADGIHWKRVEEAALPFSLDMHNQAFWDARIQKYVAYLRSWNPLRSVSRVELEDICQTPWAYDKTIKPFHMWGENNLPALSKELPVVFRYDERDPSLSDHYNLGVVPYPYAQDVYLGFPAAYLHYDDTPRLNISSPLQKLSVAVGNDGPLDIQLAVSRDGIHWNRPDREPFIGLGLPGSGRASMIYMGSGWIRKGDELWLYYISSDITHGGRDRSQGFGPEPKGWENFRGKNEHLRRAVVPLHRFISATSDWDGGSLSTPQLIFSGSKLELNIDTSAMGVTRVEILDDTGRPIEGLSLEECDPINGNFLHHIVSWNGRTDLSGLKGKPVRLHLVSRSTDLYAFRFVP